MDNKVDIDTLMNREYGLLLRKEYINPEGVIDTTKCCRDIEAIDYNTIAKQYKSFDFKIEDREGVDINIDGQ